MHQLKINLLFEMVQLILPLEKLYNFAIFIFVIMTNILELN